MKTPKKPAESPLVTIDPSTSQEFPPGKPPTFTDSNGDVWTVEPSSAMYIIDNDDRGDVATLETEIIVDPLARRICLPKRFFAYDLGVAICLAWKLSLASRRQGTASKLKVS